MNPPLRTYPSVGEILWHTPQYSDVTLDFDDQGELCAEVNIPSRLHLHSIILSQCDFFKDQFSHLVQPSGHLNNQPPSLPSFNSTTSSAQQFDTIHSTTSNNSAATNSTNASSSSNSNLPPTNVTEDLQSQKQIIVKLPSRVSGEDMLSFYTTLKLMYTKQFAAEFNATNNKKVDTAVGVLGVCIEIGWEEGLENCWSWLESYCDTLNGGNRLLLDKLLMVYPDLMEWVDEWNKRKVGSHNISTDQNFGEGKKTDGHSALTLQSGFESSSDSTAPNINSTTPATTSRPNSIQQIQPLQPPSNVEILPQVPVSTFTSDQHEGSFFAVTTLTQLLLNASESYAYYIVSSPTNSSISTPITDLSPIQSPTGSPIPKSHHQQYHSTQNQNEDSVEPGESPTFLTDFVALDTLVHTELLQNSDLSNPPDSETSVLSSQSVDDHSNSINTEPPDGVEGNEKSQWKEKAKKASETTKYNVNGEALVSAIDQVLTDIQTFVMKICTGDLNNSSSPTSPSSSVPASNNASIVDPIPSDSDSTTANLLHASRRLTYLLQKLATPPLNISYFVPAPYKIIVIQMVIAKFEFLVGSVWRYSRSFDFMVRQQGRRVGKDGESIIVMKERLDKIQRLHQLTKTLLPAVFIDCYPFVLTLLLPKWLLHGHQSSCSESRNSPNSQQVGDGKIGDKSVHAAERLNSEGKTDGDGNSDQLHYLTSSQILAFTIRLLQLISHPCWRTTLSYHLYSPVPTSSTSPSSPFFPASVHTKSQLSKPTSSPWDIYLAILLNRYFTPQNRKEKKELMSAIILSQMMGIEVSKHHFPDIHISTSSTSFSSNFGSRYLPGVGIGKIKKGMKKEQNAVNGIKRTKSRSKKELLFVPPQPIISSYGSSHPYHSLESRQDQVHLDHPKQHHQPQSRIKSAKQNGISVSRRKSVSRSLRKDRDRIAGGDKTKRGSWGIAYAQFLAVQREKLEREMWKKMERERMNDVKGDTDAQKLADEGDRKAVGDEEETESERRETLKRRNRVRRKYGENESLSPKSISRSSSFTSLPGAASNQVNRQKPNGIENGYDENESDGYVTATTNTTNDHIDGTHRPVGYTEFENDGDMDDSDFSNAEHVNNSDGYEDFDEDEVPIEVREIESEGDDADDEEEDGVAVEETENEADDMKPGEEVELTEAHGKADNVSAEEETEMEKRIKERYEMAKIERLERQRSMGDDEEEKHRNGKKVVNSRPTHSMMVGSETLQAMVESRVSLSGNVSPHASSPSAVPSSSLPIRTSSAVSSPYPPLSSSKSKSTGRSPPKKSSRSGNGNSWIKQKMKSSLLDKMPMVGKKTKKSHSLNSDSSGPSTSSSRSGSTISTSTTTSDQRNPSLPLPPPPTFTTTESRKPGYNPNLRLDRIDTSDSTIPPMLSPTRISPPTSSASGSFILSSSGSSLPPHSSMPPLNGIVNGVLEKSVEPIVVSASGETVNMGKSDTTDVMKAGEPASVDEGGKKSLNNGGESESGEVALVDGIVRLQGKERMVID